MQFYWIVIGLLSLISYGACDAKDVVASPSAKKQALEIMRKARYSDSGDLGSAARKALTLDPNCGDAVSAIGLDKYGANDFKGAVNDFTKALTLKPTMSFYLLSAQNYRYHAYIKMRDYKNAFDSCLECLKVEQTEEVALDAAKLSKMLGRTEDARKYSGLADQYARATQRKERAMRVLAKYAYEPEHVDYAFEQLNKRLEEDPENLDARLARVNCYHTKIARINKADKTQSETVKGLLKSELADLNILIEDNVRLNETLSERATVYKQLGQPELAKKDERAVQTVVSNVKTRAEHAYQKRIINLMR